VNLLSPFFGQLQDAGETRFQVHRIEWIVGRTRCYGSIATVCCNWPRRRTSNLAVAAGRDADRDSRMVSDPGQFKNLQICIRNFSEV